ncbi:hypothetical protein R6Q57_023982 [Mikania cordata]
MSYNTLLEYIRIVKEVESYSIIPENLIYKLKSYTMLVYQSDLQNEFSKPIPWIGMYIVLASLFCILAMAGDLLHGFKNKKLWFPCKYFTLNAASLTVIGVAMKLPEDLSNPMPGYVDQTAKLGSLAFMCTIMANFLPSLSSMDLKELLTSITALGFLVITVVVNVCIQIDTGVLSYYMDDGYSFENVSDAKDLSSQTHLCDRSVLAITYVALLLILLIMHASSSLAVLKSKQMLESKYKAAHEKALKDLHSGRLNVEKLEHHVSNYWIMAGTSSSLFMSDCSATTSASGVLSALNASIHATTMFDMCAHISKHGLDNKSDYKWSMLAIVGIQFIGVILGTIAPIFRCFAELSFRVSMTCIWNHFNAFKVESYWTQSLCDWRQSSITFSISSRNSKITIQYMKIFILKFCIGFQKKIVIACKMIALIPIVFAICVSYCICCWKWFRIMFYGSGDIRSAQQDTSIDAADLHNVEPVETTQKKILNSLDIFIKKAENQRLDNLMKLLERSKGFEGVEFFASQHVPSLLTEEPPLNCWSLQLVTLTSISLSIQNIQNNMVDSFLSSVREGLVYVTVVEENLNVTDDYIIIQKAAKKLWLEVEIYRKWLGNKLQNHVPHLNTTQQVLECFRDIAKNMVIEMACKDGGVQDDNSICRSICANSMYHITETIMHSYDHSCIEQVSPKKLFRQLSSMIADILAACLTNLPQAIAIKCHKNVIEEREASVHVAARLLGETKHIINYLQDYELPGLNLDEFPFIDKWHAYFEHSFPKNPNCLTN